MSAARRLPAGKISRKPRGRGAEGGPRGARLSALGGGSGTRGPGGRLRLGDRSPRSPTPRERRVRGCTLAISANSLTPRGGGGEANPSVPTRFLSLQCQKKKKKTKPWRLPPTPFCTTPPPAGTTQIFPARLRRGK